MYQISTLNALALGYTRKVVTVADLLAHGDTALVLLKTWMGK